MAYIDREKQIKAFHKLERLCKETNQRLDAEQMLEFLKSAPTEDVAPVVHARWEVEDGYCICSDCFEDFAIMGFGDLWYYCPQCGAKMDLMEGN